VTEITDYPFEETITFRLGTAKPVQFPLYLRIPGWCEKASIEVNGDSIDAKAAPLSYTRIARRWEDGDTIVLRLPMRVTVQRWAKNHNAASVDYGPLTFSLRIGEKWSRYGGSEAWPEWEVLPTTDWNYGLVLSAENPGGSFQISKSIEPLPANPFTP